MLGRRSSRAVLYLSLFLKKHRQTYYDLLDRVRRDGDWEAWLSFFVQGVHETASDAVTRANALVDLFAHDRNGIERLGRRAGSALRVHDALKARPISSLPAISRSTGLSFPAVARAITLLASMNIVRELTGKRRNRLFVYDRFLNLLSEE